MCIIIKSIWYSYSSFYQIGQQYADKIFFGNENIGLTYSMPKLLSKVRKKYWCIVCWNVKYDENHQTQHRRDYTTWDITLPTIVSFFMKHSRHTVLIRLKCIKVTWYLWVFFIHITLVIRHVNGVKPSSISRQKKLVFTLIFSETMMIFTFILKLKDISIVRHRFTSQMP